MKHWLSGLFFVLISLPLQAQTGSISGRVVDASTLKPLPFANVFINNTTIGTTTSESGEFVLKSVPLGTIELVFSFVGYVPQQLKTVIKETGNEPLVIRLSQDAQQVSEVRVKASRDKVWEKQLKRFEKAFLGNTTTCHLLNPWVVDFSDETGRMTAKALLPLEIENKSLGYTLFFQLKNFTSSATEFSIVGNIRFTALQASSPAEARTWTKNRERAYVGSVRHLMKALLDRTVSQQGFALYKDKVKGKPRSNRFSVELEYNLLPYDTASIQTSTSNKNEYRLALNHKMEVHYLNGFTAAAFYRDVNYPVSWLDVRNGYVLVNQEGIILNPTDVSIAGSMADARVSGMLPLDYVPGTTAAIPPAVNHSVKRLQEKVYLHTDKIAYYPGDNIWFSAYMNYRVAGLRDTLSRVLYVDLVDANKQIVQNRILRLDSGRTAGSFTLPVALTPGSYGLRAYTQWMRNYGIDQFFYKPLRVLALNQRVATVADKPLSDSLISITVDKPLYQTRSRVTVQISVDSTKTAPGDRTGHLSVAVVAASLAPSAVGSTIKTEFDFQEDAQHVLPHFIYPIEKGITVECLFTNGKGKGKKGPLTLLAEDFGQFYQATALTNGGFSIPNVLAYDSTTFIIQPADGKVVLISRETPDLPNELPVYPLSIVSSAAPYVLPLSDTAGVKLLKEVNVTAQRRIQSENSYTTPDVYLKGENLVQYASVAEALAAKLPDFKLIYDQMDKYLIWTRASVPNSSDRSGANLASHEPNLYINNVLVVGETVGNRLMQLSPTLIDHIEVNGMITSNQGANGSNGLLNVYLKRSTETTSRPLSTVKIRGFDRPTRFKSPDYTTPSTSVQSTDSRTTLYWNPQVDLTTKRSSATISFFTSDQPGTFRVLVEGVTSDGLPIHSETSFDVKP